MLISIPAYTSFEHSGTQAIDEHLGTRGTLFSRLVLKLTYQWKMSFDPDKFKQAQKIIFSCKSTKVTHSIMTVYTVYMRARMR